MRAAGQRGGLAGPAGVRAARYERLSRAQADSGYCCFHGWQVPSTLVTLLTVM